MVRGPSIALFTILGVVASACSRETSPAPHDPGSGTASASDASSAPVGLEVGMRAPDFEAKDVEGKTFKLSDYRGKVVLLDFWGFW